MTGILCALAAWVMAIAAFLIGRSTANPPTPTVGTHAFVHGPACYLHCIHCGGVPHDLQHWTT